MPYDSVYLEKRPPGALRTVWRKFYGDTTAMIGLYGCAGLLLLCVFGGWFAPMVLISSSLAISCCRRPGRAMAKCPSSWEPMTWAAMC